MNKNIRNHQSALDINEIWAAIEPQVDIINAQRKKRKPAFIYWLTGAILLIGIITTGLFFLGENVQNDSSTNEQIPPQHHTSAAPIIATEKMDAIIKDEPVSITEIVEPKQEATPLVSNTGIQENRKEVKNNTSVIEKKLKLNSTTVSSSTETTLVSESDLIQNNPSPDVIPPLEKVNLANLDLTSKNSMAALTQLPKPEIGLKVPSTELPELNFSIKNNERPLPLYVERPTISIEFQTGISAVNRTLNSTGMDGLDTLLNLRNTFEKSLEALHANLLVNAHFPSGFYVSSGVAFTQISEVYSNNSTQTTTEIDQMGIQKRIVNITGDTIDVIGPVETRVTTKFTKKYYNTYRMIDVPVFVGYQYDFGDWKTDFSLGVFANILLATDGRIPNTQTTDLDLSTNGDDIYRSRVDYSLQFGIGVSKSLTDKLSLRVNPMFRYYSRNFIKEDIGLSQKYLLFGGTLGLRMDL